MVKGTSNGSALQSEKSFSQLVMDEASQDTLTESNCREAFPEIIGRSQAMMQLLPMIFKVSRSDGAVLIAGESGTGKELIASAIHRLSNRASRKFIAINCSAIPEALLESELFGHERGSFTGAHARRQGIFEIAHGGTIFLDEIGDMPLHLQAKLLRVLQEKQYSPVGSHELKRSDVRIVAATNVDLKKAVEQKTFRLDLFYRLNVLPINVPSLSERAGDVPLLLDHFLEIAQRKHGLQRPCYFTHEAMETLLAHSWPGNIRELQNLVERLVVVTSGGPITRDLIPQDILLAQVEKVEAPVVEKARALPEVSQDLVAAAQETAGASGYLMPLPTEGLDLASFIEKLENDLILQALERTDNNKQKAAKLLGLNRTTLVERLKKRGIGHINSPSIAK